MPSVTKSKKNLSTLQILYEEIQAKLVSATQKRETQVLSRVK